MEIYKSIPGWEGYYEVSNYGNVRALEREIAINKKKGAHIRLQPGKQMRFDIDSRGYCRALLSKGHKNTKHKVHRLVMMAFCPTENIENLEVNHIDGNPSNNALSNLEWCTRSENMQHAVKTGLMKSRKGCKNPHAIGNKYAKRRPVIQMTLEGVEIRRYESRIEAIRVNGLWSTSMSKALNGKWRHYKGFKWKYADE